MYRTTVSFLIFYLAVAVYTVIAWIVNLIKFVNLDFQEPWRDEIIHGLGVILPVASWVTAWM